MVSALDSGSRGDGVLSVGQVLLREGRKRDPKTAKPRTEIHQKTAGCIGFFPEY